MTGMIDREFAAHVLIALAATVGAWMMFVEPKSTELAQLEQTILANSKPQSHAQLPVSQLADEAAEVRSRITEIARLNNAALNSSDLYSRIGHMANEHGVIVQNMRPGSSAAVDKKSNVQTVKIDFSVEGPYANAAEFLEAVTSMAGFVRPLTLTISPVMREGKELVTVRFVCELLRFKIPEALAAFKEADHGV